MSDTLLLLAVVGYGLATLSYLGLSGLIVAKPARVRSMHAKPSKPRHGRSYFAAGSTDVIAQFDLGIEGRIRRDANQKIDRVRSKTQNIKFSF